MKYQFIAIALLVFACKDKPEVIVKSTKGATTFIKADSAWFIDPSGDPLDLSKEYMVDQDSLSLRFYARVCHNETFIVQMLLTEISGPHPQAPHIEHISQQSANELTWLDVNVSGMKYGKHVFKISATTLNGFIARDTFSVIVTNDGWQPNK